MFRGTVPAHIPYVMSRPSRLVAKKLAEKPTKVRPEPIRCVIRQFVVVTRKLDIGPVTIATVLVSV